MSKKPYACLNGVAPTLECSTLPGVAEAVADDVERAGYVDHCEAMEEAFVERAMAGVEVRSPLPIDERFHADKSQISSLKRQEARTEDALKRLQDIESVRADLAIALVRLPAGWSRLRRMASVGAFAVFAILLGLVVGLLLAPALDSGFVANYIPKHFPKGPTWVTSALALADACGLVSVLGIGELILVVAVAGNLGRSMSVLLVLLDIAFASAWGLQRFSDGGSAMGASVTLLEFTILAVYSLALGGFAKALKADAERARKHRDAKSQLHAAEREETIRSRRYEASDSTKEELAQLVEARELAARSTDARKTLVAAAARIAYWVETGAAIEAAIKNPTLDRLHADLDSQLAERGELVAEPPKKKGSL